MAGALLQPEYTFISSSGSEGDWEIRRAHVSCYKRNVKETGTGKSKTTIETTTVWMNNGQAIELNMRFDDFRKAMRYAEA